MRKKRKLSQEHKDKIGKAHKGRKILWKDKIKKSNIQTWADPTLREQSSKRAKKQGFGQYNKGKKFSKEHREKISKAQKGKIISEEQKNRLRKINLGKKLSQETKNKISKALKGKYLGAQTSNWKGGISTFNDQIRNCYKYREWRSAVFQRDNWICQTCRRRGCELNAHHLKELHILLDENSIKTIEQAFQCKELWKIDNGVTLCKDCHELTKKGNPYKTII